MVSIAYDERICFQFLNWLSIFCFMWTTIIIKKMSKNERKVKKTLLKFICFYLLVGVLSKHTKQWSARRRQRRSRILLQSFEANQCQKCRIHFVKCSLFVILYVCNELLWVGLTCMHIKFILNVKFYYHNMRTKKEKKKYWIERWEPEKKLKLRSKNFRAHQVSFFT